MATTCSAQTVELRFILEDRLVTFSLDAEKQALVFRASKFADHDALQRIQCCLQECVRLSSLLHCKASELKCIALHVAMLASNDARPATIPAQALPAAATISSHTACRRSSSAATHAAEAPVAPGRARSCGDGSCSPLRSGLSLVGTVCG